MKLLKLLIDIYRNAKSCMWGSRKVAGHGLMFADDLVLLANN